jgi:hypothetical protein
MDFLHFIITHALDLISYLLKIKMETRKYNNCVSAADKLSWTKDM